jgi:hypothetical protein
MQDSQLPAKFPIPFANSAGSPYIRTIPQASQISIQNGAASLTDGFPPNTFLVPSAGGVGPFGQDFNGLLKQITQWNQWQQAGGPVGYDATFQSAIGGYPNGAVIASATFGNWWLSTVDNNMSDPDTGGANWTGFTYLILANGVAAGTYTRPKMTVDATGRVTTAASGAFPTRTVLTGTGTSTYTVPANAKRLNIRMIGGGGGGGGSSSNAAATGGGAGQASGFGAVVANGGGGGSASVSGSGGGGGTGSGSGSGVAQVRIPGNSGQFGGPANGAGLSTGGSGTSGPFGGAGQLPSYSGAGVSGIPNSGAGASGGSTSGNGAIGTGGGGAAGEYVEILLTSLSASYVYTVAAGGSAGAGASGGTNGGTGGSGIIIIDEFYD